jgi:uncharacterized surface protein with fasciclin (FAS1) repeats
MKKFITYPVLKKVSFVLLGIVCVFGLVTCDNFDEPKDLQITATENITSYLESNSSQFSLLLEMLNRDITLSNGNTIKYGSFLNAYAGEYNGYTLFAPTNDAVNTYLAKKGYSSVSDIPDATIEKLLSFHILADTVSTTSFTDGKLGVSTMYGQYLVVKSVFSDNSSKILVNKQGYITTKNITCGNGLVHIIDGVLEPSDSTVYQKIAADTTYSIFTEALNATHFADTINSDGKTSGKWYTVFPVSNSVYRGLGINNFSQLLKKYSNDGDTCINSTDSLNLYIGYHIASSLYFVGDFKDGSTYSTLAGNNNPISFTIRSGNVIVDEYIVDGDTIVGATIDRTYSDNACNNGVIHATSANYEIIIWHQSRVFFDLSDYSDIRSSVSGWGGLYSNTITFTDAQLSGINIYSKYSSSYATITYYSSNSMVWTTKRRYIYYNCMQTKMQANKVVDWIKFTTPFIAAGTYKVWLAYASNGSSISCPATVSVGTSTTDSVDLGNTLYLNQNLKTRSDRTLYAYDNYLYGLGMKRSAHFSGEYNYSTTVNVGFYLGKVTLSTSGKHWLKITALTAGYGANTYFDYIEFIPVDDDQIWPKPDGNGTWHARPADGYNDITALF